MNYDGIALEQPERVRRGSAKEQLMEAYRIAEDSVSAALDDVRKSSWDADVLAAKQRHDEARNALMAHLFDEHAPDHGATHARFLRLMGYGRHASQIALFADDKGFLGAEFTSTLSALQSVWRLTETASGEVLSSLMWEKGAAQ